MMHQQKSPFKLINVIWPLVILVASGLASVTSSADVDQDSASAIFRSTDSGATWSVVNSGLPCVSLTSIVADPKTPGTVYAGTDRGVFKSTDGGKHWVTPSGIITLGTFTPLISSDDPSLIYAFGSGIAGGAHGVLRSTDASLSWQPSNSGLQNAYPDCMRMDPSNHSTLYVMSLKGIYKSMDGADRWTVVLPLGVGDVVFPRDFEVAPGRPATLYFIDAFGMMKSTDAGSTWNNMGLTFAAVDLTIDPSDSSVLYALAGLPTTKLYKSTDAGNSWASILESQDGFIGGLVADPVNPSTLYLGSKQGIIRSDDAGISWGKTTFPIADASRLTFDPSTPSTIYASNGLGKPLTDSPWITALYLEGKRLTIRGGYFDSGATILLNGEEQGTKNDPTEPTRVLIGKKAGKAVRKAPGTRIQVRNTDGKLSQEVTFFFDGD